jgi:hypothetical protein
MICLPFDAAGSRSDPAALLCPALQLRRVDEIPYLACTQVGGHVGDGAVTGEPWTGIKRFMGMELD